MQQEFSVSHLDLRAFAVAAGTLQARESLAGYERIARDCPGLGSDVMLGWSAQGEMRADHLGQEAIWLHLHADTIAPMTCQRCLDIVDVPLRVDGSFRFVADEETAAAQDDDAREDLLVFEKDFDLRQLVEDELVLALPLIPRHEICPAHPPLTAGESDFGMAVAGRPNPFAVLARLKPGKG